jgi:YHS domain-containing protein
MRDEFASMWVRGWVDRRLEDEMAVDPVCGMQVDEENAAAGVEYEGDVYYFCSRACLEKFEDNPNSYVKKAEED